MSNPTRYTLLGMYTAIHTALTSAGFKPKELIDEKRTVRLPPVPETIFTKALSPYSLEQKIYLRALNDQQRYFLGDDLMQVALILNELLPRFRDLEAKEKTQYMEVIKLPEATVLSAADLAYDHLAKETPAYLRRLITSAVDSSSYYMQTCSLSQKDIVEMEEISVAWVLAGTRQDAEALKVLSLLDPSGRPAELRDTDVPRFKYVSDLMPSLQVLSNFKRSDSALFSRFVVLLPSALTWFLGNSDGYTTTPEEEDAVMDLLETSMTFMRAFQANADQAARVRQLLHHGIPVYKDLMDLVRTQSYLMSWNFEGIIYRLSQNLSTLMADRKNEVQITRFLMASGILQVYARHKNAYIRR